MAENDGLDYDDDGLFEADDQLDPDPTAIDWSKASDADVIAASDLARQQAAATPSGSSQQIQEFLEVLRLHGTGAPPPEAPPTPRVPVDWSRLSDADFERASRAIKDETELPLDDPLASVVTDAIAARTAWEVNGE